MTALTVSDARAVVLREVLRGRVLPEVETVALEECGGRVLAEDIAADRDYPPFHRASRDGFAVRSGDMPASLRVSGESRAGDAFEGVVNEGEAVEIMTGAPVPVGADAVVMVEHATRAADGRVRVDHAVERGENIARAASEAAAGAVILPRGARIDYTGIAWMASTGHVRARVYARPQVAIIATGDEIVSVEETPNTHQIRNSNAYSLAAQVRRAGGVAEILPVARDDKDATAALIRRGLEAEMLLLSGGVSAGKYDFVEAALAECGAQFYFDRVLIQPGQPLVFGSVGNRFFFGHPGNPISTMVTFEVFARAALDLLCGANDSTLPLTLARLSRAFRHKAGLTRFLPATVVWRGGSCSEVTPVEWRGSGDVAALGRANAFLVAQADQPEYAAGDLIPVLMR